MAGAMTGGGRGVELPELGPYLGRMADATRRVPEPAGLDAIRLDLVTALFERAGVARDFLLTGDREGAGSALDRTTWMTLWREAAARAAEVTAVAIVARLELAARRSRYPARKLSQAVPSADERAVLAAKLDAAGIPLEERTGRLTAGDDWWDGIRQAAVALEDSWETLESEVGAALAAAEAAAARIEAWRPSLRPWWISLGIASAVVAWLGLVLGGYLPRPPWLAPLNDWFWSLPWP